MFAVHDGSLSAASLVLAALSGFGAVGGITFLWLWRPSRRWSLTSLDVWLLVAASVLILAQLAVRFALGHTTIHSWPGVVNAIVVVVLIDTALWLRLAAWHRARQEHRNHQQEDS